MKSNLQYFRESIDFLGRGIQSQWTTGYDKDSDEVYCRTGISEHARAIPMMLLETYFVILDYAYTLAKNFEEDLRGDNRGKQSKLVAAAD